MSVTVVVMVLLSLPTDLKQRREVDVNFPEIWACSFPRNQLNQGHFHISPSMILRMLVVETVTPMLSGVPDIFVP